MYMGSPLLEWDSLDDDLVHWLSLAWVHLFFDHPMLTLRRGWSSASQEAHGCDVRMPSKGDPVGVVLTLHSSSVTLESRTARGSRVGRLQEQAK